MKKYKLDKVRVNDQVLSINHQFTDAEIDEILNMKKIGMRLSFQKAYQLRYLELSHKGIIFNTAALSTPLPKYCSDRGYYIEFEPGELTKL